MSDSPALSLPEPYRVSDLAFAKQDGLIPAVVQHASTGAVLMVGYCDADAVRATLSTGLATFFSRSRGTQWVKGESSGNTLSVQRVDVDCDADTLLLHCLPAGPTCHTGAVSCFSADPVEYLRPGFVRTLDDLIATREADRPEGSYTTSLFEAGVRRIAQKVGEEGVETALAAVAQDQDADDLLGESADLVYHLLVLLRSQGLGWADVEAILSERHF
ncbi:MAG: bifunctional phosphoribosyl-AMP cyclohydrolase/phosphoribosyl-ATP diphosphatase HisIE [Ornithinimicrobium sp.]